MAGEHAAGSGRDQAAAPDLAEASRGGTVRVPRRLVARTVGLGASAALLALIVLGVLRYPLSPWFLAGALAAYGALTTPAPMTPTPGGGGPFAASDQVHT